MNQKYVLPLLVCVLLLAGIACQAGAAPAAAPTNPAAATNPPAAVQSPTLAPTLAPPAAVEPTASDGAQLPALPIGDARQALLDALHNMVTNKYRSVTTLISPSGTMTITGEVVPPDRIHVYQQFESGSSEAIAIGNQTWMKFGPDPWQPPATSDNVGGSTMEKVMGISDDAITGVSLAGPDVVDGKAVLVYAYTSSMDGNEASGKIYVEVLSGLPIRAEAQGKDYSSVTTIVYDDSISIEAPQQ